MHDVLEIIVRIVAETPSAVRKEHLLLPGIRRLIEIIKLAKPLTDGVRQRVYAVDVLGEPVNKLLCSWSYLANVFVICHTVRVPYLLIDVVAQSLVHQQDHLLDIPDIRLERLWQHIFLRQLLRDVLVRRKRLVVLLPHLRYTAENRLLVLEILVYAVRAEPVQRGKSHVVVGREL